MPKISDLPVDGSISPNAKIPLVDDGVTSYALMSTVSAAANASAGTISNKTIDDTNSIAARSDIFTLEDATDGTKKVAFTLSGITTGTTRTLTVPNVSGTILQSGTAVTVSQGGSGRTSNTAYALIAGGTSTTAAQASIANNANIGSVLRSAGTSVLPAWGAPQRTTATASSATPTPSADTDEQYVLTALAANAVFAVPTGTATDGQTLSIRIKDNATARTLGWNAIYRAIGVTLPTTTVVNKTMYLFFRYNLADTKWDCIQVNQEA